MARRPNRLPQYQDAFEFTDSDDFVFFGDDASLRFGNTAATPDVRMNWETADTDAHYFNIAVTGASRNIIISEDLNIDWTHATSTNPTLWIQSANSADVAEYVNIAHDQTNGVITSGQGILILDAPGGVTLRDDTVDIIACTSDGVKATLLPATGDYLRIGDAGVTNNSLNTNDDLLVSGKLEVDGVAYHDGTTLCSGNVTLFDDIILVLGSGSDVRLNWETADADAHYFNIALTTASRNMIISEDINIDWTHAAQTNPTLWIQSADGTQVAQYISFTHNQTDAVITTGTGTVQIAGGNLAMANDILIQRDVNAGLTASTTQTQGQGPLTAEINEVATVANTNDTVTMPAAVAGLKIVIINNGANTLKIFPASGDNLGAGADTAVTLAAATNVTYAAYNATNWESV